MAVKEKIAYLSDLEGEGVVPSGAVQGNFAVFGTDGALADPGVSPSDFYPKATTDEKIADALASAEQFVSDQHALASYKASAWSASTEYAENDYCQYGGKGYRCVVAHTSGAGFAPTKWQLVLSVAGKAAIDAVLAPYSDDDKARLLDLCSAYNSSTTYAKGQMVLQDGVLKICTTAGRGAAAVFSSGTVDEAIKQRLAVHADNANIHVTSEEKSAWNGKQSAISDLDAIRENASAGAQAAQRDSVVVESAESVKAKKTSDPSVSVDLALKKDVPIKLSQLSNDEGFVKSGAIPTKVSQLENDKGYLTQHQDISQKADQDAIDAPYDTSDGEYAVGDTCTYRGKFYVCRRRVLQDADWNADDWEETDLVALLESGKYDKKIYWSDIQDKPNIPDSVVIDATLSNTGQAADAKATGDAVKSKLSSSSVDDAFDGSRAYAVGDTCIHNGVWYRCTLATTAGMAWDEDYWEPASLVGDLKEGTFQQQADWSEDDDAKPGFIKNKPTLPASYVEVDSTLTESGKAADAKVVGDALAEKAAASAVDSPYDTTSGGYAVGATCTHDGKWYRCIAAVAIGAVWSAANWTPITVKQAIEDGAAQVQSNWDETDTNSPAYIRNKPTIDIPEIDASLSKEGAAAEAKAVGDALARKAGIDNLPFKIVNLLPTGSTAGTTITYTLSDRSINIIEGSNGNALAVAAGKTLRLVPPSSPTSTEEGVVLARDFLVVFNVASDDDVSVSVDGLALRDHAGNSVTVVAPNERRAVYRFTEFARSGSVFLVSLEADPAWLAIQEIERALDAILADGGSFEFTPGMYLFNEGNGKYYKLSAVTDPETGETNIATDQEGVLK